MKTTNMKSIGLGIITLAIGAATMTIGCGEDPASCTLVRVENGGVSCRCLDEDGDRMGDYSKDDSRCAGLVEATDVCSFEKVSETCEATCNGHSETFYCGDKNPQYDCNLEESNGQCRLVCTTDTTEWWDCQDDTNPPGCTPTTEVCDSKDNDCDGYVDENNVCGSTPPTCTPSNGGVEACDGLDNDCDNVVDEGCGNNPPTGGSDTYAHSMSTSDQIVQYLYGNTTSQSGYNNLGQWANLALTCHQNGMSGCSSTLTDVDPDGGAYSEQFPGEFGAYCHYIPTKTGPVNIQAASGGKLVGAIGFANGTWTPFEVTGGLSIAWEAQDVFPVMICTVSDGAYSVSQ